MTKEQIKQALKLVALLEKDLEGQANCKIYGNWFEHLTDQLADELIEEKSWDDYLCIRLGCSVNSAPGTGAAVANGKQEHPH